MGNVQPEASCSSVVVIIHVGDDFGEVNGSAFVRVSTGSSGNTEACLVLDSNGPATKETAYVCVCVYCICKNEVYVSHWILKVWKVVPIQQMQDSKADLAFPFQCYFNYSHKVLSGQFIICKHFPCLKFKVQLPTLILQVLL